MSRADEIAAAPLVIAPVAAPVGDNAIAAPVAATPVQPGPAAAAVETAPAAVSVPPAPTASVQTGAARGDFLIHGNYCGVGSRDGKAPIDVLDAACMRHDACSPASGIPTCDCNARLRDEAKAIAADPAQPDDLKVLATMTASAAAVMICAPTVASTRAPR